MLELLFELRWFQAHLLDSNLHPSVTHWNKKKEYHEFKEFAYQLTQCVLHWLSWRCKVTGQHIWWRSWSQLLTRNHGNWGSRGRGHPPGQTAIHPPLGSNRQPAFGGGGGPGGQGGQENFWWEEIEGLEVMKYLDKKDWVGPQVHKYVHHCHIFVAMTTL